MVCNSCQVVSLEGAAKPTFAAVSLSAPTPYFLIVFETTHLMKACTPAQAPERTNCPHMILPPSNMVMPP